MIKRDISFDEKKDLLGLNTDTSKDVSQYLRPNISYNDSIPVSTSKMEFFTSLTEDLLRAELSVMTYLEGSLLRLKHARILKSGRYFW